jgi:glycopeptide antibiotics resistance protein
LHTFGDGYPPIFPGIAIALVLAIVLCTWVARRLGTGRLTAWLLLAFLGVILAVTLTPSREALGTGVTGQVSCDLSRIGPASLGTYLRRGDPILNVLMLVPLGLVIGQLDPRQHRRALALAAFLLPVAIEVTQAVVVPLGRACQGGDVFDNSAGLVIGLVLGVAWGALRSRL